MWRILQHPVPDDWILSSQETHSVREFVEKAFALAGIPIDWRGEGIREVAVRKDTGTVVVRINPEFLRPAEVDLLLGDSSRAREELQWKPQ
jgi:GDPmannose 4,6-dehydratase